MRPAGTLLTGLFGTFVWALAVVHGGAGIGGATIGAPVASADAEREDAPAAVIEQRHARVVDAALFGSPLADGTVPLQRIASIAAANLPKPPAPKAEVMLLSRPQSIGAGLISFRGRRVQLAGIDPVEQNQLCNRDHGGTWPCGVIAATQQRLLLRGRTVTCDMADAEWEGTRITACRIGSVDIAAWLARYGWAQAKDGSPHAGLTTTARRQHLGLFGDDPRRTMDERQDPQAFSE